MKDERRSDTDDGQAASLVEREVSPWLGSAVQPSQPVVEDSGVPPITVSDNMPAIPAITDTELDAIERYMGDILDMVLGGGDSASAASSRHKHLS